MKRILLLIALVVCCLHGFSQKTGPVQLTGVLKNFNNQADINDHSEFKDLSLPGSDRMIIPDSLGKFSITFNLSKPQYFKLGRNVLYLSPGDDMQVFVDYKDPERATFAGTGAPQNEYLRGTPFPKGGSFLNAGGKIKTSLAATVKEIELSAANRTQQLNTISNLPVHFKELEMARIKADIINSLSDMEFYYPYVRKIKGDDSLAVFKSEFEKVINPAIARYAAGFVNADYLQLETYRGICSSLLAANSGSRDSEKIKDWLAAAAMTGELAKINEKAKLKTYAPQVAAILDPAYKAAVQKVYQQLVKFGNGDEAVNFVAFDASGRQVALKDLAGKLLYIDLWATWCGPCQDELKYLEVLKQKFKDDQDIVFVSLSIDDDKVAWEKSLNARKADGLQLIINRTKLNDYAVSGIPRTILIDKNFKVLQMNGPSLRAGKPRRF